MKKIQALTSYIESLPGVNRDSMESYADLGKLIPSGVDFGNGYEVGIFRYDAVISIENYPSKQGSLLLPALAVWLGENDAERDSLGLDEPEINIDTTDQENVFVQITVEFKESLQVIEDEKGPLFFNGKKWKVADVSIDVAETLDSMEKQDG